MQIETGKNMDMETDSENQGIQISLPSWTKAELLCIPSTGSSFMTLGKKN